MRLLGDRLFVLIVIVLVFGGLAMFFSASLGLLARENASVTHIFATQLILGLIPGVIALLILRFIPSKVIAKGTLPFYIACLALTALVFVPHIGVHTNGASRWLDLGFTTVQPAEFLKIGTILMLGGYLAYARTRIASIRSGLIPFRVILGLPVLLLIFQPNTSTVIVLGFSCTVLYLLAGARWPDFGILIRIASSGAGGLGLT